ncbi:MAG: transposase [Thermoflexales bacterium]|nr:transposase [Thermoflexales bacterium]
MRTIRRVSLSLNEGKWQTVVELLRRYATEKDAHLLFLGAPSHLAACRSERTRRDRLVASQYASPHGLQARAWKMALKDGYETVSKQWAAMAARLRPRIARHVGWRNLQKRYAYWLLKSPQRLAQLVSGRAPVPTHFGIGGDEQRQVRNYLRRVIRRGRLSGHRPRAKMARSAAFDANMYETFEENGRQYIKIMSLTPGHRLVIPLTGNTPIKGNIRLVLDAEYQRVEVHYTAEVKPVSLLTGEPCGLDAGVSEVFTDELGQRYGAGFGKVLSDVSEQLKAKGQKRNKLHQIAKKAVERGEYRKARNIRRFNLGRQKLNCQRRKARAEIARQINTAVNQVLRKRRPSVVVTEWLDIRGKAKSKRLSRQVSLWARGMLKDRVEFKASAGGSSREQVNPAYSSQTCPACGYVHRDNRRGDAFQCSHCGHADDADRVAAHNLKARQADPEIHLWTPKERVEAILLGRFNARLESGGNPATVSGRTPDAGGVMAHSQAESETAGAISS